jgi:phage portal protein BeeE
MRLLDRIAERYSLRDQGYYEGMASGAAVLLTYGTDDSREKSSIDVLSKAAQAYQTNGIVSACVLARMMLLSEATFKFRSLVDKHLYGNDSLRLLEYPWPNATAGELWARMEQDVSLAGNAYIWKAEPDLLVRRPPAEMTIVSEETPAGAGRTYRKIIGYAWDPNPVRPGGEKPEPQFYTPDELVHWSPYPDYAANFRGMSWLSPVLREIDSDMAMTTYKTKYMDHGHPVSVIKYNAKLRPDTIDFISERLMSKYGGVNNAWKPLVVDQGADPIMGKGLQELDFRAVQQGSELRICSAGGVPPIIVGLRDAESGESYQTAMRRFADLTIRPLWRSGCAVLQSLIEDMPSQGVQLWVDTSDIAALQAAETERAQVGQVNAAAALTLIQAGFTRESVIAAVTSGDMSQLVADPNAPTPGVQERETIAVADNSGVPVTGPDSGNNANSTTVARPPRVGTPPGGGQVATQPQTPASKMPAPASIPTAPSSLPGRRPAANGKG